MAAVRGRSAGRLLLLVLGVTACLLASSALAQPGEETIAVGEPVPGTTPPGAPVPKREPKPTRPSKPARPPKATGKPEPGRPPAEEGPSVKIAAQLLNATGYDTLLSDNATIATIFVPTDAAFTKLARALNATAVSDLWTVPELLNASMSVLPLHIVPGAALFLANLTAELTAGMPVNLTTLAGPALVLTPGAGNMTMMGGEMEDMMNKEWLATVAVADSNETAAHVIKADMPFQDSVLHIIDAVLLPPGTMLPPGALEGEEGMGGMGEEEEIVMTSAPAAVPAVTAPTVEPGVGGEAVTPGAGEAVTPGAGGETAGPGAETGTPP